MGTFRAEENENPKLSPPSGFAFRPDGSMAISDDFNHRVQIYGPDRKIRISIGEKGRENGQFQYPRGLAFDTDGFLYVADSWNHRVQKFDPDGIHVLTFGKYGVEKGQLNEPYDIHVQSDGGIVVVERYNHRLQFFDNYGRSLGWLGTRASAIEEIHWGRCHGFGGGQYPSRLW